MQGVELPCDWTVNRRPNGAAAASAAAAAETSAAAPAASGSGSNNKQSHISRKNAATGSKNTAATEAISVTNAVEKPQQPLVTVNPLGPRSSSSKPNSTFSITLPNHGQVKRLVLQHLSPNETAAPASNNEAGGGGAPDAMEIVVESLLSRLPYKKMLSDIFGGTLRGNLQNSRIPYATRAYEESFMREVHNLGERACARGQQCECMFIDRLQPFVGVEFLLPTEERPPTPHLCVLCCRAITQQLYYDVMFDKADFPGVIQRFGNIHSEPGEYSLDAMLIAAPSAPVHVMPLPIVSHQRNRYTVYVLGGIKRLRQSRVYFQPTPSCSTDSG